MVEIQDGFHHFIVESPYGHRAEPKRLRLQVHVLRGVARFEKHVPVPALQIAPCHRAVPRGEDKDGLGLAYKFLLQCRFAYFASKVLSMNAREFMTVLYVPVHCRLQATYVSGQDIED
jgi:hypothetical protein